MIVESCGNSLEYLLEQLSKNCDRNQTGLERGNDSLVFRNK